MSEAHKSGTGRDALSLRMTVAFEDSYSEEEEIIYRMRLAKERQRVAGGRRLSKLLPVLGGAVAAFLFGGTALAVAFSTGHLRYVSAPQEHSSGPDFAKESALKSAARATHRGAPAEPPTFDDSTEDDSTEDDSTEDDSTENELSGGVVTPPGEQPASRREKPDNNASSPSGSVIAPPSTPEEIQASWERVASAMRAGRDGEAQSEIAPLMLSDDPETRDGALIVQLRIELGSDSAGTLTANERQLAHLRRLSTSGATSSIRASARRLLRRVQGPAKEIIPPSAHP